MKSRSQRFGKVHLAAPLLFFSAAILLQPSAFAQAPVYQAAEWTKTVAAAKKEGLVRFYSSVPTPVTEALVNGFRKAYPDIAIEFQRLSSAPMLARLGPERATGADGGDLWVSSEIEWFAARAKENALLRPSGPALNGWPARYIINGSAVVGGYEPFIIVYNKNLVSAPLKGYSDFLRPELKGKFGMTEMVATTVVAWHDWLEKTQGAGFNAKLKAQNPKFYVGSVPLTQAVASGEIAATILSVPSSTTQLIREGAPMDYAVPKPGFAYGYGMGALAWSKRPNAALVMLDYLMSVPGQTAWHGKGETASPRSDVPGALPISSISPWDPFAYPPELAKTRREHWMQIYK